MTFLIAIITIGAVAWRYRKILGLTNQWDHHGAARAEELAARLGWSKTPPSQRPAQPQRAAPTRVQPVPVRQVRRSFWPRIDTSQLPAAVVVGVLAGVVALGIDLQGFRILAIIVGMAVAPFFGGVYLRTRWWILVAPIVAIIVGVTGETGPFAAPPIAALAYAGVRSEVIMGWLAREDEGQ